jgi:holo-[acyl-carrier protein] synthase
MQIIGVGLDATEIDRVSEMIDRYGDRFLRRVFTEGEIDYCHARRDFASSFAARFAAKEAAMKALGTGWSRGVRWRDIEVAREPGGKPTLRLAGEARQIADRLGVRHISMTITHSGNLALAQVIFES